jgi:hypothetical protein
MTMHRRTFPQRQFEGGPTPEEDSIISAFEAKKSAHREDVRASVLKNFGAEMSPDDQELQEQLVQNIRAELQAYFNQYGLSPNLITSHTVLNLAPDSYEDYEKLLEHAPDVWGLNLADPTNFGGALDELIHVRDTKPIPGKTGEAAKVPVDPWFKDAQLKMTLAHEAYHYTAPPSYWLLDKGNQEINERTGLAYGKERDPLEDGQSDKDVHVLEEGMAMLFQERFLVNQIIPSLTPEKQKRLMHVKQEAAKQLDVPAESIIISNDDGVQVDIRGLSYPTETAIVKILKAKLASAGYDLERLIEEARINNKTISLAKAIDQMCGEGMYRRLSLVGKEGAKLILKELQEQ